MKRKKSALLGLVIGLSVTATSVYAAASSISDDSEPLKPDSGASLEQHIKWKNDFKKWAEKENKIRYFAGEKTKGSEIIVANKKIKLPDDVYLDGIVDSDRGLDSKEEYHKHLPFYVIVRGNSKIMIAERTGFVVNEIIDPSDEHPFAFLEKYIEGYIPEVKKHD